MSGSVYIYIDFNQRIDHSLCTEWACIFFKILCTWFPNRVNPILLAYGCPFTKDSAILVTNSILTLGGIGGSKGSTDGFSDNLCCTHIFVLAHNSLNHSVI